MFLFSVLNFMICIFMLLFVRKILGELHKSIYTKPYW